MNGCVIVFVAKCQAKKKLISRTGNDLNATRDLILRSPTRPSQPFTVLYCDLLLQSHKPMEEISCK